VRCRLLKSILVRRCRGDDEDYETITTRCYIVSIEKVDVSPFTDRRPFYRRRPYHNLITPSMNGVSEAGSRVTVLINTETSPVCKPAYEFNPSGAPFHLCAFESCSHLTPEQLTPSRHAAGYKPYGSVTRFYHRNASAAPRSPFNLSLVTQAEAPSLHTVPLRNLLIVKEQKPATPSSLELSTRNSDIILRRLDTDHVASFAINGLPRLTDQPRPLMSGSEWIGIYMHATAATDSMKEQNFGLNINTMNAGRIPCHRRTRRRHDKQCRCCLDISTSRTTYISPLHRYSHGPSLCDSLGSQSLHDLLRSKIS